MIEIACGNVRQEALGAAFKALGDAGLAAPAGQRDQRLGGFFDGGSDARCRSPAAVEGLGIQQVLYATQGLGILDVQVLERQEHAGRTENRVGPVRHRLAAEPQGQP